MYQAIMHNQIDTQTYLGKHCSKMENESNMRGILNLKEIELTHLVKPCSKMEGETNFVQNGMGINSFQLRK